ncbi:DGKQ [Cordylochernes scorpioides]|uniref:Diacylglycerol kinase n=1 Tax=Cordylochernes scorpioides TaxID=51811 RepID=A0ABY6K2T7_9ARAC|nr:DGKQ [Cordylochernes scorpioides]
MVVLIASLLRVVFYLSDKFRISLMYSRRRKVANCPYCGRPTILQAERKAGKGGLLSLGYSQKSQGDVSGDPKRVRDGAQPSATFTISNFHTMLHLWRSAISNFQLHDKEMPFSFFMIYAPYPSVHERMMDDQECPWELMKNMAKESVRQRDMMRFYLRQKKKPTTSSNVALFVGNLTPNLSERQYENILLHTLAKPAYRFRTIGPIYYEYGSLIITYDNADIAVKAFYMLREAMFDDRQLLVLLLPKVKPDLIPDNIKPLLVFVNVKSGGCQGLELISSFRRLLNPYQVYDLDNGGPLPGLYVFRHIRDYKILVCGGDGTVGWVLQCLDNVGQDSECQSPPCAILPLGTGNDLARVLRWGAGYAGGEDPLNLLRDVIEAEEIWLDRWTVVFHSDEKPEGAAGTPTTSSAATSEDNTAIFVMNNYFGIGLDADLCLDFHNAREEHPDRFNSRLHNKGVYVKMGFRKMVTKKACKDLQGAIKMEVDGRAVEIPSVEGIIILNILSWGSGANPWGPERDDQFAKPTHFDGLLEVVGITGVVHMGQIQSGMRSGVRIAQGAHIRIRFNNYVPVQVDGEPWIQGPGEAVVLKSALKAKMLKKSKSKFRRRNTEPRTSVIAPIPFL